MLVNVLRSHREFAACPKRAQSVALRRNTSQRLSPLPGSPFSLRPANLSKHFSCRSADSHFGVPSERHPATLHRQLPIGSHTILRFNQHVTKHIWMKNRLQTRLFRRTYFVAVGSEDILPVPRLH
jgi:hypothetical protein